LKAVLRNTGERLDYEMRRADQAELRARTAEGHSREVALRIATAENGRHQAELETARVREETKRFQLLAEASERELRRVEADMQRLERMRKEAEQNAADSRDLARKAQQALREHQAREEGREEGRMLEMRQGFETGRSEGYASGRTEGYNAGRLVGFEEGRKVGWSEGYADGLKQGRREERVHAIEAFDKFMDSEERRQSRMKRSSTRALVGRGKTCKLGIMRMRVGARRKGAKALPRLPLSAFTPPNTGSSEAFPLPPSPSTLQPEELVDAYVIAPDGDLSEWKAQAGETLRRKTKGVVLALPQKEPAEVEKILANIRSGSLDVPVVAVLVPVIPAEGEATFTPPAYLESPGSSTPALVPSAIFTKNEPRVREALQWALKTGHTVHIDVQCDIREVEGGWDALEEMLTSMTISKDVKELHGKIVVSNILPPPDDLALPIVKLLTHPSYRNYQSHAAALSLFGNVWVNLLPPAWGAPVPSASQKERNEWKRRLKMY
ncbi:predicted protein, partial [Postia placenta Mad-698-R]